MKPTWAIPSVVLLLGMFIYLSFNLHSKAGYISWKSEIYADKAGYYVYLPAAFIYKFNASAFPDAIDSLCGNGFRIDRKNNRIRTKYPYGTALLQTPFFLAAHVLAKPLGYRNDGFSVIYHKSISIAAGVYLLLALMFLYKFLERYFRRSNAMLTLFLLLGGTNIFYYGLVDTGMSHVYSFFVFSLSLWIFKRWSEEQGSRGWNMFSLGLAAGLIFALRHINLIFLVFVFFLDIAGPAELKYRLKRFFAFPGIFFALLPFLAVALPQLAYNHYQGGSVFYHAYHGESFANYACPKLAELWFSTRNGLFTYSPANILILTGAVIMIAHNIRNGWLSLALFMILSYVFASWWMWWFGCGYGGRTFVEYYALLSLPVGYSLKFLNRISILPLKYILWMLLLLMVAWNITLIYKYPRCWFWGIWDWERLVGLL